MRAVILVCCVLGCFRAPAFAQQSFTNITTAAGIDGQTGLGHAVGWCDYDGDGDQDLAFSNQDATGFWLYRNNGDETFTDVTMALGLSGQGARKILWAEVTHDQRPDLLLENDGCRLFRNDGVSGFSNTQSFSGLQGNLKGVLDADGDGHLDVATWQSGVLSWFPGGADGHFGLPRVIGPASDCWTTVCFDYDLDGDNDLYVGTYGTGANRLFRNDGSGVFTEVAGAAQVAFGFASHGLTVGDFDNDGWPDLYIGGYSSQGCRLYRNLGDGTFADVTTATGTRGHNDTRTVSFVDYDNDGWLDIFSSHHDFYSYSNTMQRNNGDGTFTETAADLGLSGEFIGDYFGVGWADFNDDGALDLFCAGHIDKYELWRNDQNPGSFLKVHLVGSESNYSAVGAAVELFAGERHLLRQVIGGSGRQDGHSLDLHFGLGGLALVDSLVIMWPGGRVQTAGPWAAGQTIELIESDPLSGASVPGADWVVSAAPNPFNPQTTITVQHSKGELPSTLDIFDARGHRVRRLHLQGMGDTLSRAVWDGRGARGQQLPSGGYLVRVGSGPQATGAKLLLLQ